MTGPLDRVARLPETVINQIAAGEVVERPASVVKELLENAIDAESTRVVVEITNGGLDRIRITDDGIGMSRADAELALERHATSKLRVLEDLDTLGTLGFRGEAIPSIASVSRFTLTTAERGALEGTQIVVSGGRVESVSAAGAPAGTTIDVRDLFYNVPARKKFMKRPETESSHVHDAVVRLALARPQVAIKLVHNGRTVIDVPAATGIDPHGRLGRIFGREVAVHLFPLAPSDGPVVVTGWCAAPELSERTTRGLYTFVNGRFVRDRTVQHAAQEGYRTMLERGRYPVVVLAIDVDPALLDVNVHPQKTEVRFAQPNDVHRAIASALARTLAEEPWLGGPRGSDAQAVLRAARSGGADRGSGAENERPIMSGRGSDVIGRPDPVIGRGSDVIGRPDPVIGRGSDVIGRPDPVIGRDRDAIGPSSDVPGTELDAFGVGFDAPGSPSARGAFGVGFDASDSPSARGAPARAGGSDPGPFGGPSFASGPAPRRYTAAERGREVRGTATQQLFPRAAWPDPPSWRELDATATAPGTPARALRFSALEPVGQVMTTFLVCEGEGRMVLIDQHAAHERIAFERMRRQRAGGAVTAQPLLVPHTLALDATRAAAAHDHREALAQLGFELEPFGGETWALKTVPLALGSADVARVLLDVLDELRELELGRAPVDDALQAALSCAACHTVVRAGDRLTKDEIRALLVQMDEIDFGAHCPHGRPVFVEWSDKQLATMFHRT